MLSNHKKLSVIPKVTDDETGPQNLPRIPHANLVREPTPGSDSLQSQVRVKNSVGSVSTLAERPSFGLTADREGVNAIRYGGTWNRVDLNGAYGGKVRHIDVAGRTAPYTFTGSNVAWVSTLGLNCGKAEVWLDGELIGTVDLNSVETQTRQVGIREGGNAGQPQARSGGYRPDPKRAVRKGASSPSGLLTL